MRMAGDIFLRVGMDTPPSIFYEPVHNIFCRITQDNADDDAGQYIGWKMNKQVQARKGNGNSQREKSPPEPVFSCDKIRPGSRKGRGAVTRGKGRPVRRRDGNIHGIYLEWPGPAEQGFYSKIDDCGRQHKGGRHDKTDVAGIFPDEQDEGQQYPDNGAVAKFRDKAENKIKHIASHMCLKPE